MSKSAAFAFVSSLLRYCVRPLYMIAITMLLMVSNNVAAESLTTIGSGTLASLPGDVSPEELLNIDGRTVALGKGQAWALRADNRAWEPLTGKIDTTVHRAVAAGGRAYLLEGGAAGTSDRLLSLQLQKSDLKTGSTVPLPLALTSTHATVLGDTLYLSGNDDTGATRLYSRSLAASATSAWKPQTVWPQTGTPSALQAQKGRLYAVVGGSQENDQLWRWSTEDGWQSMPPLQGKLIDGSMRALGQAHLLMLVKTPGGKIQARTFHSITSAWNTLEDAPAIAAPQAITSWGNGLLWASTGADGSQFQYAQIESSKHLLRWLDWAVIIVYLAAMLGIGAWFYFQEKHGSTSDFFVGGRSIPFWAAGISLYATNTSSISFIAIPAKAFETNWQYMTNNLIAVLGLMFVAIWIVPLLRRLDLMSVFSYLETRFHPTIRMLASGLCIVIQIGSRMSVILFLPALAISTITGIDVVWSILLMGVFTIIYTTMGGMKAVIWTDFVQVFVMFGGAIFAIGFIIQQINGGMPEFLSTAMAENKTQLFDFSFDLTKATVWGFIFLVVFDVVLTFPKDQVLMQRVLSTKSDKEAGRSIWTFAAMMIPGGFVFYGIGTALWVYYKNNPERLNPLLPIDATFPLFIAAELPMGVTGLIIAGIFAAAMSTLSSIINSVSTLASVDFYERLKRNPTPKQSVRFAEWIGVLVGLIAIGIALVMSRYDIHSLFDVSIELAGLLGGGFAGAYTLGMFTRRANWQGVAIGVAGSILITLIFWSMSLVHPYFYLAISILLCIVIGYLASLFFPPPAASLKGLTIYKQDTA